MAFISGYLFDFCNYFDETDAPIHSFIINFKSLESLGCPWCNIARNAARQLHRVVGWNCCAQCRLQCCKSRSEFSFGNHACSELKSVDQWPFSQLWARVAKWNEEMVRVMLQRVATAENRLHAMLRVQSIPPYHAIRGDSTIIGPTYATCCVRLCNVIRTSFTKIKLHIMLLA